MELERENTMNHHVIGLCVLNIVLEMLSLNYVECLSTGCNNEV